MSILIPLETDTIFRNLQYPNTWNRLHFKKNRVSWYMILRAKILKDRVIGTARGAVSLTNEKFRWHKLLKDNLNLFFILSKEVSSTRKTGKTNHTFNGVSSIFFYVHCTFFSCVWFQIKFTARNYFHLYFCRCFQIGTGLLFFTDVFFF